MLLLMLLNGEGRGVRFEVSGRVPVFIGRHALGLDKPDSRMSRQHAELWHENGTWLLRDLNSTNGTFINGKRVKNKLCELEVGDHLRCGRTEFVVADIRPQTVPASAATPPEETAIVAALGDSRAGGSGMSSQALADAAEKPKPSPDADLVSLDEEDQERRRHDRALIPPQRSRPVPAVLEAEDEEPAVEAEHAVEPVVDKDSAPAAEQPPGVPSADADVEADAEPPAPALEDAIELDLDLALEDEAAQDEQPPARAVDSEPGVEPDQVAADPEVTAQESEEASVSEPDASPDTPDEPAIDVPIEVSAAPSATEPGDTLAPTPEEGDEYGAEPAVFGLSLRHTPPSAPPEPEKSPPSDAATEPEPVAEADPEAAEPTAPVEVAQTPDAPVGKDSPPVADVSDNAPVEADTSDSDEDEDLLKLGFKGDDKLRDLVEVDEPGLRGATPPPGRFVITEEDDEPVPALEDELAVESETAEPEPDTEPKPHPGVAPEPTKTDEDPAEAAARWAEPSRSRGPSGRGRQRLPLAVVGVLVVVACGAAWLFAAKKSGLLAPDPIAGKSPADTSAATGNLDSTDLGATSTNGASAPDRRGVFVDLPASDAPPTTVTADPLDDSAADALTDTATPNATAPGLSIPAVSDASAPTPAEAPRVASAADLNRIIESNTAPTTADAGTDTELSPLASSDLPNDGVAIPDPVTPADPAEAIELSPGNPEEQLALADNPRKNLAWSGLNVGDPDSPFTAPPRDAEPTDEQVLTDAIGEPSEPAIPEPIVLGNVVPAPDTTDLPSPDGTAARPAVAGDVAYLVDISGTMIDSMPQLRKYLRDQIDRLQPEQQFSVILFRQGEALELPPRGLRPAEATRKTDARDWLAADAQNIRLGGRSDPTVALQTALRYGVDSVVILSDNALGRRAKAGGADLGLRDLTDLLDAHPGVTVHAVQFFYPDDRRLLQRLARRFGGHFEFVEEIRDVSPSPGSRANTDSAASNADPIASLTSALP